MSGIKIKPIVLAACLAAVGLPQAAPAAGGCEALNGTWEGSENPVGEPDAVETKYQIKAEGTKVDVTTGKLTGSGDCTAEGDKYTLKMKFRDVDTTMTFHLLGSDVAMFYWENSKGAGGRGALTLQKDDK